MINKLAHSDSDVAQQIFNVFQRSYAVEARFIGVDDFPPLARLASAIEQADTAFYGFFDGHQLAGVIEITWDKQCLDIDSLTVDPDHFKKGIAGKLIRFVLDEFAYTQAAVETAVANTPAINLYKKYGFAEVRRFTPAHGIEKLAMLMKPPFTP